MELVRAAHPDFPATQPLELPVTSLADAARLIFTDPVYLDSNGQLWITRPDAPSVASLLEQAWERAETKKKNATRRFKLPQNKDTHEPDEQTFISRDQVVFAYFTFNDMGEPQQQVVVRKPEGNFALINLQGQIELGTRGRQYDWDRARWIPRERDSAIVVPTDTGMSIFRPQARPIELYQEMASAAPATPSTQPATSPTNAPPQFLLDPRGLLAWVPPDDGKSPSVGAFRFVDGKWEHLDESRGWPLQILQLVPLLDGSVLQIVTDETNLISIRVGILDRDVKPIDEGKIVALVAQLSDPKLETREAAHAELTRYGPQVWPILEKLQDAQPPEGRLRIEQLLRQKAQPMLGRLILQPGRGKVVARFADGGALLWAESGVVAPDVDPSQSGAVQAPAWISIRANQPIALAPPAVVNDLDPDRASIEGFADEWIVIHDVDGPMRLLGNHLEPMLRKSERGQFRDVIGYDSRGRWLFRGANRSTLIVDPWLPDATPRLPVWRYPVENGAVGWTADNWPVVKSGGAWVIDADGTRPLKKEEEMFSDIREMPETLLNRSSPATAPTTNPTAPSIGTDGAGGKYFDGKTELRRLDPDGRIIFWTLPDNAVGSWANPKIFEADGKLFLFNEAGRVIRLRRAAPGSTEPFVIETIFTNNIPNAEDPRRIWLDPAGRIVIATNGNQLTLLFPTGRIPPAIAQRMLASDLKANEPE